jgi:hypothetical protein
MVIGWAKEMGMVVSSPPVDVEARWVSIETRQVLTSADLELVVAAGRAVEAMGRVVRSAAGTLTLMRQLGGAASREPSVAWCEEHEQFVTRCRSAGSPDPAQVAGQPAGLGQRPAKQELDLRVGAAQLVARPAGQRVVDRRVQPQQELLTFGRHD